MTKLSNTSIRELSKKYRTILRKCAFLNAAILIGITFTTQATAGTVYNGGHYLDKDETYSGQNVSNSDFLSEKASDRPNNANFGGYAFVNRGASLTVKDSTYSNLTFDGSGTVFSNRIPKATEGTAVLDISGTTFTNNHSYGDGGAIANFNVLKISNSKFEGNTAQFNLDDLSQARTDDEKPIGGGAIALGSVSDTDIATITDTEFSNNKSGRNGGAIGTRLGKDGDNSAAKLNIAATFIGNSAQEAGGAIYNTFYANNTLGLGNGVTVTGNFTNNSAGSNGGAIYNDGSKDAKGNYGGVMTITNSQFSNNTANSNGGAIYNSENASLTLAGTNIFTGNTAGGKANDIYNAGTLNISGDLTLDGGITGTGVLNFADNSSLTATLNSTTALITNNVTVGENVFLKISNGTGTYEFISGTLTGEFLNTMYDLDTKTEAGKIIVSAKSADKIAEESGISTDVAQTLSGIAASETETATAIATAVQEALVSGNVAVVEQELTKINPDSANASQKAAVTVASQVAGTVSNRLSGLNVSMGRNGGDIQASYGVWAEGMYNKSKLDGAFRGYTQGFAVGFDTLINDTYTLGLGYAYTATDVKSDRKTKAYGDNFFLYGQYKPSNWFVNGMLSYGHSDYKEVASAFGVDLSSNYDIDAYAGQIMTGYEFKSGFTSEMGLRYLYLTQDEYNNGVATIDADNNDILTGVATLKYTASMGKKVRFMPEFKAGITYDIISDGTESTVTMGSATPYVATGDRLARFGGEFGIGAKIKSKNMELSFGYDLNVRRDYTSQTGSLKLKYNF